ncbi:MAG: DUF2957 domain-containing protein [bacterium]|jgi:hypothetical protein|uniref:DUF2957 domain-containing protein n=1 Tax=Ralstonia sp. TaxID=54061 RepID=UPI001EA4EAE6|nr:MAG: DUF2957 domain-containing protein [Ralstonia sp.]
MDGGYIGTNSAFAYVATLVQGNRAALLEPSPQHVLSDLSLDFTQPTSGLVDATLLADQQSGLPLHAGDAGAVISVGGIYGMLFNGPSHSPFFNIGAFVQK